MINLLPTFEKRRLRKEFWLRFAVLALGFVVLAEVITVVSFFPSYYSISMNMSNLTNRLEMGNSRLPKSDGMVQDDVDLLRTNISLLKGTPGDEVTPSYLIDTVARIKGPDITLWEFAYDRTQGVFEVRGFAKTRDALTLFRKNMRDEKVFTSADLPSNLLLKESNIDFTMKVSLKK